MTIALAGPFPGQTSDPGAVCLYTFPLILNLLKDGVPSVAEESKNLGSICFQGLPSFNKFRMSGYKGNPPPTPAPTIAAPGCWQ